MIRLTCYGCKKLFRARRSKVSNSDNNRARKCRKCLGISSPNKSSKVRITKPIHKEEVNSPVNKINKRKKK